MRFLVAIAAIAALATAPAAHAGGFAGISFSDAQNGWALVSATCPGSARPCTAVEGTTDGGRTWTRLASLPASAGLQSISRGTGVAFGNAAFVASDGGRNWARVPRLLFESVAPAADATFALTYAHSGCPAACDVVLRRAASGSGVFRGIPSFRNPSLGFGETLVGSGSDLYAVAFGHIAGGAEGAYARLAVSHDGGSTWVRRGDPCREPGAREVDSTQVVAAGSSVALLCVVRGTGAGSIALSRDGGRSFSRVHPPVAPGYADQIALDAHDDLALLTSVDRAGAPSVERLALSYDGGRSWRTAIQRRPPTGTAPGPPDLSLFGRSIRWLQSAGTLLRSDDGGGTWQSTTAP
jgi:photosystem II stability/assembly factor-like uncharacterized protein